MFALLAALAAGALWVAWLDHRVRTEFEGKRWSLPARVYARPLELFAGTVVSADDFESRLERLGYRYTSSVSRAGDYLREGDRFEFISREFTFWDGQEPSRRVSLGIRSGRVGEMLTGDGRHLPLMRLEPEIIGKIYPAHRQDRILLRLSEVPPELIEMLIAVEDRGYFGHAGVDPKAILRALLANLRAGAVLQGGSTLTQQLVKNFFLSPERSLSRKLNEAIMALLLDWHYDKHEILEAYLNEVYLGQDGQRSIHGFGLAASFYFGRPLPELDLEKQALLVGLVRGPSFYNPRSHPQRALERRNLVLRLAGEQLPHLARGADAAAARGLGMTADITRTGTPHPAYLDLVRRQLSRDYREEDLRSGGLRIFTALDPVVQRRTESLVRDTLAVLEQGHGLRKGVLQAAVSVVSVHSGEVLALVGSRKPGYAGFNRALDAQRQIGSLVKPAVYLAALTRPRQFSPLSTIDDAPVQWQTGDGKVWSPANYDKRYHGRVTLLTALSNSYNAATVHLGRETGVRRVAGMLRLLGIERDFPAYPSLLLGAVSLSPLEVTRMYHTLAGGGFRMPLQTVRSVLDSRREPLKRYELSIDQVLDPASVFILNGMLEEVLRSGTARSAGRALEVFMPLAGKTGTTDDLRDSWFAGFGDDLLVVVWTGRDDNLPAGLTGADGALKIWTGIMQALRPAPRQPSPPAKVAWRWLDGRGRLVASGCPGARRVAVHADSGLPEPRGCAGHDATGRVDR